MDLVVQGGGNAKFPKKNSFLYYFMELLFAAFLIHIGLRYGQWTPYGFYIYIKLYKIFEKEDK